MHDRITALETEARASLESVATLSDLELWEQKYLGRKSALQGLLSELRDKSLEEKKTLGPLLNTLKRDLAGAAAASREAFIAAEEARQTAMIDVTAPGPKIPVGHLHPITRIEGEVADIFASLGFDFYDGPELETENHNFDSLNFPKDHPARDMQDTFWVKSPKKGERLVLRTHTSPGQVRYMQKHKPPFRVVVPGRVFRNEATDASHEHTFHQFECFMVDEAGKVSVATFKYIAATFFEAFFGTKVQVRLRPSFFPFTEPSFEFDISCVFCDRKGCGTCKQTGWMEIGGAGMIHQRVFEAVGYPRGKYQGFAWGFGLTRLAMIKYGIPDIRLFMGGDIRFLEQFS